MTHRHESGCQKVATLATNARVANDLPERHVFYVFFVSVSIYLESDK